ncbi:MobF family relaxase [Roseimaritima sediminicola]|uniref:MobF family relaxase n=1 Tax=Roseimaritima sediminicola TaxID=2662066 RepID=UPI0012983D7D|nr:MobF family relaxase [Roseimaritima sediminicola]
MLTATQAKNIVGTSRYFDTVLTQGDYYTGTEISGSWNGKATAILGLEPGSPVISEEFKRMLSGRHPITDKQLAQRMRKDRRPGFDLTFSVPKSVSAVWAINNDEAILEVLREAVHETMERDVEPLMCRRVRNGVKAASQHRVKTGNLVYADFLHKTSRPVDGVADPHLHIHAFVMNHTTHEGKHYAAEPEEIFRQRLSLQAAFEARLARKLEKKLGYAVTRTAFTQSGRLKKGWEIAGIERSTIEKFSRRTTQVENEAQARGITDAEKKGKLGAVTREKKDKGVNLADLQTSWNARLSAEEKAVFSNLKKRPLGSYRSETQRIEAAIRYSLDHHLFRQSTAEKHAIVGTALEHGVTLRPEDVEAALQKDEILQRSRDVRGAERAFITTQEVLDAESRMIVFARDGRGTRMTIARREHEFEKTWLHEEQKAAVLHVLNSRDTVTAITGGAGTGKSSLMEEAARGIKANGKELFVFAPSTGAREVLEEKGFANAQTVEHLLRNEKLHASLKDQVVWIDESGLLDVRSMNGIFDIAKAQNCRVVLSGDTKQHSSPRRGEAMRLLETEAGINVARVQEVQRQKGRYKQAVEAVSLGDEVVDAKTGMTGMLAGFDMLDRMGKIKEIASESRHAVIASRYLKAHKRKRSTLIVSPTHAEGRLVTAAIRARLRATGAIGREEQGCFQLRSLNLTDAQKSENLSYAGVDLVVQFHQNVAGGFKRGERYRVSLGEANKPVLQAVGGGPLKPLPKQHPDRFEVYREETVCFSKGDKIRFSLGGTAIDGKRKLTNGRLDTIKAFDDRGNLVLESGLVVSKDYGHFDLGYCITSHASQGKDRDLTIAAIGSQSLPAVNAKQFYVTVSRGRKNVAIYVDDKAAVRRAIQNAGEQQSATELLDGGGQKQAACLRQSHEQRFFFDRVRDWWRAHASRWQSQQSRAPTLGAHSSHYPGLGRT